MELPVTEGTCFLGRSGSKATLHVGRLSSEKTNTNAEKASITSLREGSPNSRNRPRFPELLHYMLEDAEKAGFGDIVGWLPDGLSFKIYQPKEFTKKLVPRYFRKQSKFRSFQRQVRHHVKT